MVAVYDVVQRGRENWLQGDPLWSLYVHPALQNTRMHACTRTHKHIHLLFKKPRHRGLKVSG